MKREDVDKNKITPMMRQYLQIKEENEDNILFLSTSSLFIILPLK